jgi:undecaprenyl pyrophosphate synthase
MALTASNTGMCLTVALNYGGRAELVDAFNAILRAGFAGTAAQRQWPGAISRGRANDRRQSLHRRVCPIPICLIRTSGECA